MPPWLPLERWAFTPPFHPYRFPCGDGGLFSVALSVTVFNRAPTCGGNPAHWCPDFPHALQRANASI